MERPDFLKLIAKLVNYYERKSLPTTKSIDLWFEDVKAVDAEALGAIFDTIKQGERFPSNLPAAILSAWREWARSSGRASQGKTGQGMKSACQDCDGDGLLFVKRRNDLGYEEGLVFRCARCGSATINAPMANLCDLLARGFEMNDLSTVKQAPIIGKRGSMHAEDHLGAISMAAMERF